MLKYVAYFLLCTVVSVKCDGNSQQAQEYSGDGDLEANCLQDIYNLCNNCDTAMSDIEALYRQYSEQGVPLADLEQMVFEVTYHSCGNVISIYEYYSNQVLVGGQQQQQQQSPPLQQQQQQQPSQSQQQQQQQPSQSQQYPSQYDAQQNGPKLSAGGSISGEVGTGGAGVGMSTGGNIGGGSLGVQGNIGVDV